LPCRYAVGDLRPARDDDRRVFDFLRDVEDHWCVVLLVHPVFLQNIYNFWQNCMYKNASFF
jgi:hypothetical protein